MFTRKEYATSVSGKTANGGPVRSAKPPDNMNFHFISPCGAKLYEVFLRMGLTGEGSGGNMLTNER